ncbi:hypothetical protein ACIQVE_29365 [Pseudomonas sp. NPDC098747]|uniref:hypothetical protein n=1 Tax=Pseudomonas sp. NPDC098747 TaxID=3364487 RepID=UPI00383A8EAE
MTINYFKVARLILSGALLGLIVTNAFGGANASGAPEIIGAVIGAGSAAVLMKLSILV